MTNPLSGLITAQDERIAAARAAYSATRDLGKLAHHRILSYRCERRCLLLDVLRFPDPVGIVIHAPRHKVSPTTNSATSNDAGRLANTEDGNRRWKEQTYIPAAAANYVLNCDHVRGAILDRSEVEDALARGIPEIIVTP